ncbi:Gfo/Idh/MocA family oxidoreductase [Paenibacillus woosongensis]|uniref:Gfo/Idh/MocA family oxidoreductase n=1 Tax=Paenibacillus woosongensis TaxID=307580 RepID=A0AA95L006_9BACL|nr:Gfo/Idh/MocA family oxidoreductase [Paenibacillus woosongensis]WHX47514.1 Gfo/Idh/MocA family oxidoreductase [Paenibacillus woosongensis]
MTAMRIGIIGCGNISPAYLNYLKDSTVAKVTALADLLPEKAAERAKEYGIEQVYSVEEMLQSPDIDIILNLTIPASHAAINIAALEHGKHVYAEKPLSISLEDAKRTLELAEARQLRVGCAPDTFLGAGLQTSRMAIQEGRIGRPVAASAFMMGAGPEGWHPNPDFFYQEGGGPMFDMGPYYLTALVNLLGPITRVSSSAQSLLPERIVKSGPRAGTRIPVHTPTHYSGTLDFAGGAIGTLITSFDIPGGSTLPRIEIYGTEGSLLVPDPNCFDGEVKIRKYDSEEWSIVEPAFAGGANERGKGIEDMARAILENREHRASGKLAYHVLEAMHAFLSSSREERHIHLESASSLPSIGAYRPADKAVLV